VYSKTPSLGTIRENGKNPNSAPPTSLILKRMLGKPREKKRLISNKKGKQFLHMPYSIKYVERQKKEYLISIGNTTNKEDNHKKEMKQSGIKKGKT